MKLKKVECALLRQNCYALDRCEETAPEKKPKSELYYETIDEVTRDNALVHERRLVPYEITQEYLDSFVESADYRRDPVRAIINAPERQNLGDIRDFQQINEMDDTQVRDAFKAIQSRYEKAKADFDAAQAAQAAASSSVDPAPKTE